MRTTRPRFSLRALGIFVTLVCAYFASWGPTKREAARFNGQLIKKRDNTIVEPFTTVSSDGVILVIDAKSPAPLFIYRAEMSPVSPAIQIRYYLWLFGTTFKLPYEGEWQPPKKITRNAKLAIN